MNLFWTALILLALLAVIYAFARPYLRTNPTFKPFYDWIEPIEMKLWSGSRTVLISRLLTAVSLLVGAHDVLAPIVLAVDWTPFIAPEYQKFVPLLGVVIGPVFEWLRRISAPLPSDEAA